MISRPLVDPDLVCGLEQYGVLNFTREALPAIRQEFDAKIAAWPVVDADEVATELRSITTVDCHDISVTIFTPKAIAADRPAILHIHGGGYVLGSPAMNALGNRLTSLELDCVIVSIDYRLSPEASHPGPIEDCYAGLKWLYDNARELGVDRNRIAVMGESAGGGLAAALALMARDRGEISIIHQHLIYPMLDDRTCLRDPHPFAGEFVWTMENNQFGWESLLGCKAGSDNVSHYAAPARATDLTGLPSTFIAVGALDLFLEEDIEYARRLMRAGVRTEMHIYPGAYHGFHGSVDATVTKSANSHSSAALRRAIYPV